MADRRAALWAVMAAFLAVCCMPRGARAHGFMAQPAARNVIHSSYYPRTPQQRAALPESYWNYCPHCLAAGGPGAVSQNSALTWPEGRAGLCGDMYDGPRDHEAGGRYATEEVAGTYEEGSTMEIKIGITAHHNGRFEFKICRISAPADGQTWVQAEKAQLTQECFNQHVLVQANMKGAQRPYEQFSYLPFKTWGGYSFDLSPPYYSFYYTVPDSLGCDGVKARCILQWHWVTGNSCTPPGTPDEYREKAINECGSTAPYPEEFWNCADILTAPRTNRPPSPPSPPSPPPRPPAPPIQSPPPPPPPAPVLVGDYPCSAGDAYCFCNWKGASGSFADPKKNCEFFYQCATGQYFYTACPGGLRYREDGDYCDLPTNVACKASGTSPGGQASPSASLSPSPRPPPPVSRSPPPRPPPNSPPPKLPPPVNSPPPNSPPTNPPPTQRSPPRPPPPRPFPPQPSPSPPPPSPVTVLRLPSPRPPSPPAPVIRRPPPPPPSRRRWTWWG